MTAIIRSSSKILGQHLQTCTQRDFSGILEVDGIEGQRWRLRFFLGRLVGDAGGLHPCRRWQRQFARFAPKVDLTEVPAPVNGMWNYVSIEPLVRQGIISQKQILAILQGSAREVLFQLVLDELGSNNGAKSSQKRYSLKRERVGDFERAPLVSVEVLQQWEAAQKQVNYWVQEGLTEYHPSLAPVINEPEQLIATTSEPLFNRLKQLLDGNRTLWDVSLHLNRSLHTIAKSFAPHIRSGSIQLIPASDELANPGQWIDSGRAQQKQDDRQSGYKIAYLDDAVLETQIMGQIVRAAGHDFLAVNSPLSALGTFLEYKPDLIFLDLVMPIANGYEICAQLRRIASFKDVPVVIVTGSDGIVDRMRSKLVGANGFVSKPISADKVSKAIGQYLLQKAPA